MSMPISCVSFFSAGLRRLLHPCTLADYIARALLRFKIYFPDVLAYDAEADKLYAADKADYARHARPACDGFPGLVLDRTGYRVLLCKGRETCSQCNKQGYK